MGLLANLRYGIKHGSSKNAVEGTLNNWGVNPTYDTSFGTPMYYTPKQQKVAEDPIEDTIDESEAEEKVIISDDDLKELKRILVGLNITNQPLAEMIQQVLNNNNDTDEEGGVVEEEDISPVPAPDDDITTLGDLLDEVAEAAEAEESTKKPPRRKSTTKKGGGKKSVVEVTVVDSAESESPAE